MRALEVHDPNLWAVQLHVTFYSSQPTRTFENPVLFRFDPYCSVILVLNLVCVGQIFLITYSTFRLARVLENNINA